MQRECASVGGHTRPGRARRRGHDHRENREPMRICQLQRYLQEPAADLPIAYQAQHDAGYSEVGAQNVDQHCRSKRKARYSRRRRGRTGRSCAIAEHQQDRQQRAESDLPDTQLATDSQPDLREALVSSGGTRLMRFLMAPPAACRHDSNIDLRRMQRLRGRVEVRHDRPGTAVSAKHSRIRNAAGAASMTRSRGVVRPLTDQNKREANASQRDHGRNAGGDDGSTECPRVPTRAGAGALANRGTQQGELRQKARQRRQARDEQHAAHESSSPGTPSLRELRCQLHPAAKADPSWVGRRNQRKCRRAADRHRRLRARAMSVSAAPAR